MLHRNHTLSLIALVLLTNACALNRPADTDVGLTAALEQNILTQARHDTIQADWWQAYNDPKLNRLIEQGLANNLDLKQAAINVNKALYQAKQLGAEHVPNFNLGADASYSRNLNTEVSNNGRSVQMGISYELDLWQRLAASTSSSIWEHRASQHDMANSRATLINNLADTYFQIAYLNQAIELEKQALDRYRELHRIAQSQYRHGKVSAAEPEQSQAALLSAEQSLQNLQQNHADAITTLRNLLNLHPEQNPLDAPETFTLPQGGHANLAIPLNVLTLRPDLHLAEARLQAAAHSLDAQKRSWLPRINLNAAISSGTSQGVRLFEIPILNSGISISLPFLNWPTLQWQNRTAQANFEQAQLQFAQTLTTALNEVHSHHRHYRDAQNTLKNQETRHQLAQNNSRYHRLRYQHGKSTFANWLSALNSEDSSSQALLNAHYQALKAENQLYKAMGGRHITAK